MRSFSRAAMAFTVFAQFACSFKFAEPVRWPVRGEKPLVTVQKRGQTVGAYRLANGLEVLLISDARFQKSAAALSVAVGSWSDPDEHLGLAHFLEHMLFLGTEKYPDVGEYNSYISKNGGHFNAYTSVDHTNYHFEVNHSAFAGAIDRFPSFSSPQASMRNSPSARKMPCTMNSR